MKQIRIVRPKPVRPRQNPIDTRTPSGRVLPY
jgi:transcription elongation GreA/GreB family factor